MASTNTNTDNQNILSTDIYEVAEFLDQIRADNIPDLDNTSSIVGIFGYMNEMFSQTLQNTLIAVSETSNEAIATRAKFSKNVIAHAMNLGITDINAKPAVMTMMIYLPVQYLETNFSDPDLNGKATFILDKNCPIYVDSFEFHLDYDVIITRIKNPQGQYVYTAMYDLFETGTTIVKQSNLVSDITNPYITTIIQCTLNGEAYVAFSARLHQVNLVQIERNILTDNTIENKVITFDFDDQLATFDVDIAENNTITHLTPIYSGLLDYTVTDGTWCYYEYINEYTIRVVFSRDSYVPGMNAVVTINVQLTDGAAGNFTYTENFRTSLKSERFNDYNGMYAIIYPLLGGISSNGKDKKSIKDLRRIIPREASSRGAVVNTTDLQNFFNSINDENCKLYFKKKRDNPFERMYYSYMLMKKDGYVYPTNTLDLTLVQDDFKGFSGNNNLVISPGTVFYYYDHGSFGSDYALATVTKPTYIDGLDPDEYPYPMIINEDGAMVRVFDYVCPFLITIDDDLLSSYLLTIMNDNKTFRFDSINTDSNLQFVATNMNWHRRYIYTDDEGKDAFYDYKYTMDVDMTQNNMIDYKLIKYHMDANGDIVYDDIRVKMFMVLYADGTDKHPYRYLEAEMTNYDRNTFVYTFRFTLNTDDFMDLNNRINITGIYNCKPEELQHKDQLPNSHGYMNKNTYAKIYILADFGIKVGDTLANGNTATEDEIIVYPQPTPENPTVTNIGNRDEIEALLPTKADIIADFLRNELYLDKNGAQVNVVTIMKSNPAYMQIVKEYNNDEQETASAILRYLRNNANSDFVINTLLKDEAVLELIDSYNYIDFTRWTLCNVMSVEGGLDFYHDYSAMMRSVIAIRQIPASSATGEMIYKETQLVDELGNPYTKLTPVYRMNEAGTYFYNYIIRRIPMIRNEYLSTEQLMQEFIYDLEERRKYIEECLYVLEDTFDIDLKFFNTYGPSKMFYYNIPASTSYKVRVSTKFLYVVDNTVDEADSEEHRVGILHMGDEVMVTKVKGQWGYITSPYEGWIKLADTAKTVTYIDNVALTLKFSLEAQTSADKYIAEDIVSDVKEYIEDINEITELHVPNIITLITNNYREQLVWFEFLDVNGYGAACQHLYLDEHIEADICPEFLNVATNIESVNEPEIDIAVF